MQTTINLSTARKDYAQICQELPHSAESKQTSTKGSTGISLQARLAETDNEDAKPQNEGVAVPRRMASSIQRKQTHIYIYIYIFSQRSVWFWKNYTRQYVYNYGYTSRAGWHSIRVEKKSTTVDACANK